jgi:GMP synthase (glutamine-hydrolysing)
VFWGVQYHPELDLHEVAGALRRQSDELVKEGLVASPEALEGYAHLVEELHCDPDRRDLAWCLGLDEQVTSTHCRVAELRNFIGYVTERQS